ANLSSMFLNERMLDSAITYGIIAMHVRPFLPSAYISVGQAYFLLQDLSSAESVFSVGSGKCGSAFRYGNYLHAGILLERGDIARAEAGYRSILRPLSESADPRYEAEFLMSAENKIGMDETTLDAKALYGLGHVF